MNRKKKVKEVRKIRRLIYPYTKDKNAERVTVEDGMKLKREVKKDWRDNVGCKSELSGNGIGKGMHSGEI